MTVSNKRIAGLETEDDLRRLAFRIANYLEAESKCLFRDVPPAEFRTLLGVGYILAYMRQQALIDSNPLFSFSGLAELVDKALAQDELDWLSEERFSADFVNISETFRLVTVGPGGVILEEQLFVELER